MPIRRRRPARESFENLYNCLITPITFKVFDTLPEVIWCVEWPTVPRIGETVVDVERIQYGVEDVIWNNNGSVYVVLSKLV